MPDNIYWHEPSMVQDGVMPSIVAIGDSWFWYPLPGGSLASSLAKVVAPHQHTLLVFGNNGAEAFDYVNGVYAARIEGALGRYGTGLSAVFVSGGGNDFAGFNDLRPLLGVDCSACATADACFNHGAAPGTIEELFDRVTQYHVELIDRIAAFVPAAARVFVHNYDYALPSGQAVIGLKAWLKPALVAAKVPPGLRTACVRYIIDQFSMRLADLRSHLCGARRIRRQQRYARSRETGRTSCIPKPRASTRSRARNGNRRSRAPGSFDGGYAPRRGSASVMRRFSVSTRLAYARVSSSNAPL